MIAAAQTKGCGRGKSGLRRAGCQITSGGGDSQDSATEMYRVSNEPHGPGFDPKALVRLA